MKRFQLRDQAAVHLFVQNVGPKEVECGFDPPYHPGDWILNITDRNGERIDVLENRFRGGILIPPDPLFAKLAPGEIQPVTGSLPRFRTGNEDEGYTPEVKQARFTIVQEKPEELRALPPFDYLLPAGEYLVRCNATLRKTDSPDVTFAVESARIPFHVGVQSVDAQFPLLARLSIPASELPANCTIPEKPRFPIKGIVNRRVTTDSKAIVLDGDELTERFGKHIRAAYYSVYKEGGEIGVFGWAFDSPDTAKEVHEVLAEKVGDRFRWWRHEQYLIGLWRDMGTSDKCFQHFEAFIQKEVDGFKKTCSR